MSPDRRTALAILWDGLLPRGLTRDQLVAELSRNVSDWVWALTRLELSEGAVIDALLVALRERDPERISA